MGDDRFRLSGAPPDESYGRVTNPERFQPVVDAARSLIERLSSEYQVSVATTAGGVRLGRRIWGEPGAETVHLSPVEGAPISFVINGLSRGAYSIRPLGGASLPCLRL